jgi:hypothetical protein
VTLLSLSKILHSLYRSNQEKLDLVEVIACTESRITREKIESIAENEN